MFVNPIREIQSDAVDISGKYFRGRVVDNDDPDKIGRVRIRVPMLHRFIKDEQLPWAIPMNDGSSGTTAGQVGSLDVPPLGAYIWMTLLDNDLYYPMYFGAPKVKETIHEDLKTNYPHSYGRIDRSGNLTLIDTHEDAIIWHHVSGTLIRIDGAGRVLIQVADEKVGDDATEVNPLGLTIEVQGNAEIYATQDAKVHAGRNVDVQANGSATVRADGAVTQSSARVFQIDGPRTFINSGRASGGNPRNPPVPTKRKRPVEEPFEDQREF